MSNLPEMDSENPRTFLGELKQQRWDDHRYYHHSRINQSLHLLSAFSFLTAYALLTVSPSISALVGWLVAMWSRQIGHFFFEPKNFDTVNQASHEHKEEIKVGYNLKRKIVLLTIWALSPLILYLNPSLFGLLEPHGNARGFVEDLAMLWLALGLAGLLFRTIQLFFVRDPLTGLAWCTKILTDPFHDVKLYHRSPFFLLRGQLIDPMTRVVSELEDDPDAPGSAEHELKPAV